MKLSYARVIAKDVTPLAADRQPAEKSERMK